MNFWTVFVANVVVSFVFSYVLVKYGNQYKKYYSFFIDAPAFKFKEKIILDSTFKFEVEHALSFFLIPLSLIMLAILSYVLSRPLPNMDQAEFFFMCFLGEAMLILLSAMTTKVTFETFFQDKELRDIQTHELFVTEAGFAFPVTPLEGVWREIARKARKEYLFLRFDSIELIEVEPARGLTIRPKPPYYRISLKNIPLKVHLMRKQFYGREKKFLEIAAASGIKIIYNDQLRD